MHQNSVADNILVIDIGNTNISCGIYQNDNLIWFGRLFSSRNRTADGYFSLLSQLLKDILTVLTCVVAELVRPLAPASGVIDKTLTLDGIHLAFKHLKQL